jgi:putative DNA primase/helicase
MRRHVNDRGEPIKTESDHGMEYSPRMSAVNAEGVTVEYFVLSEVFKSEVCQGFDSQAVARVLLAHECLIPSNGRTFACKQRLLGMGPTWCYRIPHRILELDL